MNKNQINNFRIDSHSWTFNFPIYKGCITLEQLPMINQLNFEGEF